MIGAQRSRSACWIAASCAGDVPVGFCPNERSLLWTSGRPDRRREDLDEDADHAGDVRRRKMAYAGGDGSYPSSRKVGTSGMNPDRSWLDVTSARIRPSAVQRWQGRWCRRRPSGSACDRVRDRRRRANARPQSTAAARPNMTPRKCGSVPIAGTPKLPVGIGLEPFHQLVERTRRHRRVDGDGELDWYRSARSAQVGDPVVGQRLEHQRINRLAATARSTSSHPAARS